METTSAPVSYVAPWNEEVTTVLPMFAIPPEVYQTFNLVVNIILTPLICLLGIVGNAVGIYIIKKDSDSKKHTIYIYMLSLMTFDIGLLVVGIVACVSETIKYYDVYLGNFLLEYCPPCKGYGIVVLKHVTAILLIIMSIERWMSLVFPYTVKQSVLSKYPRTIVATSFIFSAVYIIPFVAGTRVVPVIDATNRTIYVGTVDEDYFEVFFVYTYIETTILHYIAPLGVLVFNVLIIITYSRLVKQRTSVKPSQITDNQRKITLVVLGVASLYVMLSLPNMFVQTLIFIDEDYSFYGTQWLTFRFFIDLGDLMSRINAASDFFMYILVSSHYRAIFQSMIYRRDTGYRSSTTNSSGSTKERNISSISVGQGFNNI